MVRTGLRFLLITLLAVVCAVAVQPAQAGLISEKQELQMGRDAAREVESQTHVLNDARKTRLVETVGKRLVQVSERPKLPWKFQVLDTKEINALSVPGYVYVNDGLLNFIGNDRDQLAAVIAHEVAHTTRKHAVRQTEKALVGSLALQFFFRGKSSLASQLAGMAANMALLGYGRQDELEADHYGTEYLIRSGYDPQGMVHFFEKLRTKEGKEQRGLATYFRTHPPTSDRIRKVQEYLNSPAAAEERAARGKRLTPAPAI